MAKAQAAKFPKNPRGSYKAQHGRRLFSLDLRDHVKGLWDDEIPFLYQCVVEGVGVDAERLNNEDYLSKAADVLCSEMGLNVRESLVYPFQPGITAIYILSESHLALHTWPEKGYLHLDLVTCTKSGIDQTRLSDTFGNVFKPSSIRSHKMVL